MLSIVTKEFDLSRRFWRSTARLVEHVSGSCFLEFLLHTWSITRWIRPDIVLSRLDNWANLFLFKNTAFVKQQMPIWYIAAPSFHLFCAGFTHLSSRLLSWRDPLLRSFQGYKRPGSVCRPQIYSWQRKCLDVYNVFTSSKDAHLIGQNFFSLCHLFGGWLKHEIYPLRSLFVFFLTFPNFTLQ